MRYCPPMIFAHRVLYERGEGEIGKVAIRNLFGAGGRFPSSDDRWMVGQVAPQDLVNWNLDETCYGRYVGFRNRDDQFLFYMTFEGQSGSGWSGI